MSTTFDLESIGLDPEELQERVIERIADQALTSIGIDEWGDEHDRPSSLSAKLDKRVKEHIDNAINRLAEEHVLPNVSTYIENLTIQETNKWGESKGKELTFIEYLVERAEAYLREQVDHSGKGKGESGSYSWHGCQTRITHLVHEHLQYSISSAMKDALKVANGAIAKGISETVEIQLAKIVKGVKAGVQIPR